MLDLVEHVADLSRDAPILLLCMARPLLLERRPSWGGGKWNATTVRLEPLDGAETERLLSELGGVAEELRGRVLQAAEGNPLFLEEMLALVGEAGGEAVEVPPTIKALLAARLDQLDPAERAVLGSGSVEGRTFHRGAVAALADGGSAVDQRLVSLVRKELVRPDRPQFPEEDAYRFRHLLIRDAAYDALPKAVRADLHARFAAWLEQHGSELVELDEILGYHIEQAARYLHELGRDSSETALAAGERLAEAGRRAYWRGDHKAAASLIARALALTRPHKLDVRLELDLVRAVEQTGMASEAAEIAEAAVGSAEAVGDETGVALASTVAGEMRSHGGQCSLDELERLARVALPPLQAAGDDDGLFHVLLAVGHVAKSRFQNEDWAKAREQALLHARRAGHPVIGSLGLASALTWGPRPAAEALAKLDALVSEPHPIDLMHRAVLLAMLGQIEQAWAVALPAEERARELGFDSGGGLLAEIAALADDNAAAAAYLRSDYDDLEASGNTAVLASYAPRLACVLCHLGRHDEAEPLAWRGSELGNPEQVLTQVFWRQAQALVQSARGQHAEAEQHAREAVDFALRSDSLFLQGEARSDLAEVLEAAGKREQAVAAWRDALDRYERKQVIPLARRVRERLEAVPEAPA